MKIEIDIHNALSGGWQRKKICVRPLVLNNGYWDKSNFSTLAHHTFCCSVLEELFLKYPAIFKIHNRHTQLQEQ